MGITTFILERDQRRCSTCLRERSSSVMRPSSSCMALLKPFLIKVWMRQKVRTVLPKWRPWPTRGSVRELGCAKDIRAVRHFSNATHSFCGGPQYRALSGPAGRFRPFRGPWVAGAMFSLAGLWLEVVAISVDSSVEAETGDSSDTRSVGVGKGSDRECT